jgi:hypothetical protein
LSSAELVKVPSILFIIRSAHLHGEGDQRLGPRTRSAVVQILRSLSMTGDQDAGDDSECAFSAFFHRLIGVNSLFVR